MSEQRFFWKDAVTLDAAAETRNAERRAGRAVMSGFGLGALAGAFVDTIAAAAGHDTYPIGIAIGSAAGAATPGVYSRARDYFRGRSSRAD